jgi:hypothetical protein
MASFAVGVDTFGRVKQVGNTPIVTRFFMLSWLPIWPLQSYYRTGEDVVRHEGVPFLFHSQTVEINGIPLRRIDRLTVVMAYLRAFAAVLTLFGSIAMVPGLMALLGERLDRVAIIMLQVCLGMLAAGIVLGLGSYAWPFQVSRREFDVRTVSGLVLGHCIDPALVEAVHAQRIMEFIANAALIHRLTELGMSKPDAEQCVLLVGVRAAIGREAEPMSEAELLACEVRTDDVLIRLQGNLAQR